jgi:hypothetical protein
MNIFVLDKCPQQSAIWHCDKHCVKMVLESIQLVCSVYHMQGIDAPYKLTHKNHPCAIWARTSCLNFEWLIAHSKALLEEYRNRYNKIHKSFPILEWCDSNSHHLSFDLYEQTDFAIAISDDSECRKIENFDELDAVEKYKWYYKMDKKHLHTWKQNKPYWIE